MFVDKKRRYGKMVVNLIIAVLVILFLIFVLPRIIVFFMPFVIGWIIAMIANPLVKFLEKHVRIRRKQGSVLIIVAVLALVCTLSYFLISALVREGIALIKDAPAIFGNLQIQITKIGDRLNGLYERMPADAQILLDSFMESISSSAEKFFDKVEMPDLAGASSMVSGVVEGLLMFFIAILSAYFFVADREELGNKIRTHIPTEWYDRYVMIKQNFAVAIGGYFKAQFKIMLILVVVMFVAFEIIQVSYFFLLAVLIGALDFLPVLGTGTVLWPWMLMELMNGNYFRLIGLFAVYLVCQIIKQVLQPKMVGDSVGISPLATLFFMYIGYRFGGVFGMIIGIPIGMVLIRFYEAGVFDRVIGDLKTIVGDIDRYRKGE